MPEIDPIAAWSTTRRELVGRDRELDFLFESVRESLAGCAPSIWLLTGPPGIGKSALADGLAARLASEGVSSHWGSAHDMPAAPTYWPWGELLRRVLDGLPHAARARLEAGLQDDVAELIRAPAAAHRVSALDDRGGRSANDPEEARFHFFDGVSRFLRDASRSRPLLLVLDDLHWADTAAIDLAIFLGRELRESPIALVGTYREVELQQHSEGDRLLGEFARTARQLPLSGVPVQAVRCLIEGRSGTRVSPEFSRAVWQRTEGNPFFVGEMTRLMLHEGTLGRIDAVESRMPHQVGTTIRRHLRHLPEPLRELLSTAAVLGRTFDPSLLAQLCGRPLSEVMHWLEDRSARGVVDLHGDGQSISFSHGLLQRSLYDDMSAAQRMQIHGRILDQLTKAPPPYDDERIGTLTRHAVAAGDRPNEVIGYATETGHRARRRYAYRSAAEAYLQALEALDQIGGEPTLRLKLLLLRGEALLDHGDLAASADLFQLAFDLATELDDPTSLARAAIGFSGGGENGLAPVPERAALLQAALDRLDRDDDPALRSHVLSLLAGAIYFSDEVERPIALAREALDLARMSGERRPIAVAIDCAHWITWTPTNAAERLAMADEYIRHAQAIGSQGLRVRGYVTRFENLVELGEAAEARAVLDVASEIADQLGQRWGQNSALLCRALLEMIHGRFELAEEHARAALEIGKTLDPTVAAEWYYVQLFLIREAQGRQGEILDMLRNLAVARPTTVVRAGLARMLVREGELEEAGFHYRQLLGDGGPEAVRVDVNWPFVMACLAELASAFRDLPTARRVRALLEPYRDQEVVLGLKLGWAGSVVLYLGQLAGALGEWDQAFALKDRAMRRAAHLSSAPARLAAGMLEVDLLLGRAEAGDREVAGARFAELEKIAVELGAERRLDALRARIESAPASSPASTMARAPIDAGFTHRGDFWIVSHGGDQTQVRDLKGLHQLAMLLREPGREFHVLDLLDPTRSGVPVEGARESWLDFRARREYALRLAEVRESLAEAERMGDTTRASASQAEVEALARELSRHVGLGGRNRVATHGAERARVNVTRTIRQAIERIAVDLPELARHLRSAVRTGAFCSYEPKRDGARIRIEV